MNEMVPAGFLRRMFALVIDAITVLVIWALIATAWVIWTLASPPEPNELPEIALERTMNAITLIMLIAWIGYIVLSWTPILGRRTVGMRQMGIQIVRDPR